MSTEATSYYLNPKEGQFGTIYTNEHKPDQPQFVVYPTQNPESLKFKPPGGGLIFANKMKNNEGFICGDYSADETVFIDIVKSNRTEYCKVRITPTPEDVKARAAERAAERAALSEAGGAPSSGARSFGDASVYTK